jgi:hypothetical protein
MAAVPAILRNVHQQRFGVVLCWHLARFSREGVTETLNQLQQLQAPSWQFKFFPKHYLASMGLFREASSGFVAARTILFVHSNDRFLEQTGLLLQRGRKAQ